MNSSILSGYSLQWIDTIFHAELKLHPAGIPQDWYKLFFQAVFGPGHAIHSEQDARDYFIRELQESQQCSAWDIQHLGRYTRVNIRLCHANKITTAQLFDAFINSVEPPPLDAPDWQELWHCIVQRIQHLHPAAEKLDFTETCRWAETRQMCSHSTCFRQTYHPHYRVVKRELL